MPTMGNAGKVMVALFIAGVMLVLTMMAMPTIQPVLVSVAEAIGNILTADGEIYADFVDNSVIPILPIAVPIITFIGVYIRVSRGGSVV